MKKRPKLHGARSLRKAIIEVVESQGEGCAEHKFFVRRLEQRKRNWKLARSAEAESRRQRRIKNAIKNS